MEKKKMNNLAALVTIALGILLLVGLATAYADIYVTKIGCPDPDGSSEKPYHMVESGIVRTESSPEDTVRIEAGKYYETFTTGTPCTLKTTGGTVTIGKMDYQASTTLDIITLNTHLAGDMLFPEHWQECKRTNDISDRLKGMEPDKPDVVSFQEIWDEDFFFDGDDYGGDWADAIIWRSGYCSSPGEDCAYADHGDEWYFGDFANSGLALMSLYPLEYFSQFSWDALMGDDAWANKGYVETQIVKDGFSIGLFNLHAQAEWSVWDCNYLRPMPDLFFATRYNEMRQLAIAVKFYRLMHPSHVVFVMGDFNIYSDYTWPTCFLGDVHEYYGTLIPLIGYETFIPLIGVEVGGRDAARNSPGFIIGSDKHYTYSQTNDLAWHFDKESPSGRLDYIFYFPSLDGLVEVLPMDVNVLEFRGRNHCCINTFPFLPYVVCGEDLEEICITVPNRGEICFEAYLCTNESSDHWGVRGRFKLIRKKAE